MRSHGALTLPSIYVPDQTRLEQHHPTRDRRSKWDRREQINPIVGSQANQQPARIHPIPPPQQTDARMVGAMGGGGCGTDIWEWDTTLPKGQQGTACLPGRQTDRPAPSAVLLLLLLLSSVHTGRQIQTVAE